VIKSYYRLTKPGIIYGNAIVAAAAFIFGSHDGIDWTKFFFMLVGLSFVIGSACVFNNYYDRGIDARMERTKKRALVTGKISNTSALIFGVILLALGIIALHHHTNMLALEWALVGFIIYVFVYTPLKAKTGLAVFVGAVAGATPPVVGYTAATNSLDIFALLLFAFLFLWQLPHFFAIARHRYSEYQAAGVPLLVTPPQTDKEKHQARLIFRASLIVLLIVCLGLVLLR
jgi:protoheme IX farnesyltransferase